MTGAWRTDSREQAWSRKTSGEDTAPVQAREKALSGSSWCLDLSHVCPFHPAAPSRAPHPLGVDLHPHCHPLLSAHSSVGSAPPPSRSHPWTSSQPRTAGSGSIRQGVLAGGSSGEADSLDLRRGWNCSKQGGRGKVRQSSAPDGVCLEALWFTRNLPGVSGAGRAYRAYVSG